MSLKRFLPKSSEPIVGTFHLPLITFVVLLTASTKVEEHFFTGADPDFPPILIGSCERYTKVYHYALV